MKRSERMHVVQSVAAAREKVAAQQLGKTRQILNQQLVRLEELSNYRQQYVQQFADTGSRGISARSLQDYRVFVDRLNTAIRQQDQVVEQARVHLSTVYDQWMQTHSHTLAIGKLIGRFRDDEKIQENRLEQKLMDEFVAIQKGRNSGMVS
ncbi:MAG: flagellar export protein FliJ [Gammaproteobacteria bacterium]